MSDLPLVSVVFVTYRRLDLLKKTYAAFRRICTYPNLEYILCDDGSPENIQREMKQLPFDVYCFSEANRGLGHNQNKGILAARGEYILQLQDDWLLNGPGDFVHMAIQAFDACPQLGFIRLWSHPTLVRPSVSVKLRSGIVAKVFEATDHPESLPDNQYLYSDRPHIKRRQYHEELGLYREDLIMNAMETEFCLRFERQRSIATGLLAGYEQLFEHIGLEQSFNPTQKRANWRARLDRHWFFKYPWRIYVRIRYGRSR